MKKVLKEMIDCGAVPLGSVYHQEVVYTEFSNDDFIITPADGKEEDLVIPASDWMPMALELLNELDDVALKNRWLQRIASV